MAARPSDARISQIAFWKKHQSILQNCADLTQMCNVKILVSFFAWFIIIMQLNDPPPAPQCIMTLPDKMAEGVQQEFRWDEDQEAATGEKAIHTHFVQGTTIVFDSFSDELDVKRRNSATINISKINNASKRFPTDFNVKASGDLTAVLCASTVSDYRVVDVKRGHRPPSFSTIICKGLGPSDSDIVSSLAACASPVIPTSSSLMALSTVASGRLLAEEDDQLRKRCKTVQRRAGVEEDGDVSSRNSLVNRKTRASFHSLSYAASIPDVDHKPVFTTNAALLAIGPLTHATTVVRNNTSSFFVPVLRPIAVQQALLEIFQKQEALCRKPVSMGTASAPPPPFDARYNAIFQPATPPADGMGDGQSFVYHPPLYSAAVSGAAPQDFHALSLLRPAPGADVKEESAFSVFGGGSAAFEDLMDFTDNSIPLSGDDTVTLSCW
jgi:hypothetical protein